MNNFVNELSFDLLVHILLYKDQNISFQPISFYNCFLSPSNVGKTYSLI